jgi:hypothetical protein
MADLKNSSSIWNGLMRPSVPTKRQTFVPQNSSRTECIRAVLRQTDRPMSAAEILFEAAEMLPHSANTSLISMLLKWDIRQGRVVYGDGCYFWNSETAAAEVAEVQAALNLLKRRGYVCKLSSVEIE